MFNVDHPGRIFMTPGKLRSFEGYGTFWHQYLLVHHNMSPLAQVARDTARSAHIFDIAEAGLRKCKTKDDAYNFLFELSGALHEYKHFTDVFCTPYGYMVFRRLCYTLVSFFGLAEYFRQKGQRVPVPLSDMSLEGNGKECLARIIEDEVLQELDIADYAFATPEPFRDIDIIMLDIIRSGKKTTIPAGYLRATIDERPGSIVAAFGLSVIMEATASIVQEEFLGYFDFNFLIRFKKESQKALQPAYSVLDQTISRIAKRRGVQDISANDFFKWMTHILGYGGLPHQVNEEIFFDKHVGWQLYYALLDANVHEGKLDIPLNAKRNYDSKEFEKYTYLTQKELDQLPSIADIHKIFVQDVILPGMSLVIGEIEKFETPIGFLKYCDQLPIIPAYLVQRGDCYYLSTFYWEKRGIKKGVQFEQAWWSWLIILGLLKNIRHGQYIWCPYRDTFLEKIFHETELSQDRICKENGLIRKRCGIFRCPVDYEQLPDCSWSQYVRLFNL